MRARGETPPADTGSIGSDGPGNVAWQRTKALMAQVMADEAHQRRN